MSLRYLLLVASSLLSGGIACKTTTPGSEVKVIGGEPTTKLPQVGLLKRKGGAYCSGTLIAPTKVVTAAHCVVDTSPEDLLFVIDGASTPEQVEIAVTAVLSHPRYAPTPNNYDIGLVTLAKAAPYPPLAVVRKLDPIKTLGKTMLTVGYGRNKRPSEASSADDGAGIKRQAELTVTALSDTKIRVGGDGKSACNGDSGGAYIQLSDKGEPQLAAVTSCGDANCSSYGVATRVDAFLTFLGLANGLAEPTVQMACSSAANDGLCDGNKAKVCRNDCFEASLRETTCLATERCRIDPYSRLASCYDPTQLKDVKLRFKQLIMQQGQYAEGKGISDLYLFLDLPESKTPPNLAQGALSVNSDGAIDVAMAPGAHHFEALVLQGTDSSAAIKRRDFFVDRQTKDLTFVLPVDQVKIEVTGEVSFGQAVYITGQGELLGSWKRGLKLSYDGRRRLWFYEGALVRQLEFKLFRAPWVDDATMDLASAAISWEGTQGNHQVGEGGIPYQDGFHQHIVARFR